MSRRTYAPLDALEARRICQLGAAILAGFGPVEEAPLWDDDERWGLVEDLCGYAPAACGKCGDLSDPAEMDGAGWCPDCSYEWNRYDFEDDDWDDDLDLPF